MHYDAITQVSLPGSIESQRLHAPIESRGTSSVLWVSAQNSDSSDISVAQLLVSTWDSWLLLGRAAPRQQGESFYLGRKSPVLAPDTFTSTFQTVARPSLFSDAAANLPRGSKQGAISRLTWGTFASRETGVDTSPWQHKSPRRERPTCLHC